MEGKKKNKTIEFQKKMLKSPSGPKFEISASKCQDGKRSGDQIYGKTQRAPPHRGPRGPRIDFSILKSHGCHLIARNHFHYNGAFVRLHVVLVYLRNGAVIVSNMEMMFFPAGISSLK